MANDEELVINIKSDTSDFEKGVKKVTQKTEELAKATEQVNKKLEHVDDAIKEVSKDTDKLSESTKKLTAEEEKSNYNVLRRAKSLEQYVKTLNEINIHHGDTVHSLSKVETRYNKLTESIKNVNAESKHMLNIQQSLSRINQQRATYRSGLLLRNRNSGKYNELFGESQYRAEQRIRTRMNAVYDSTSGLTYGEYYRNKINTNKENQLRDAQNAQLELGYRHLFNQQTQNWELDERVREAQRLSNALREARDNAYDLNSQLSYRQKLLRGEYEKRFTETEIANKAVEEDRVREAQRRRNAEREARENAYDEEIRKRYQQRQLHYSSANSAFNQNLTLRYGLKGILARVLPSSAMQKYNNFTEALSNRTPNGLKRIVSDYKSYKESNPPQSFKKTDITSFAKGLDSLLPTYKQIISWSYKLAKVLITQVVPALAKAGLKMSQMTASGVGKFFKGMGTAVVGNVKAFNKLKSVLTGSQLHLGKLAKMFKNVILYRVFRTIIHSISTAFAEGTKNVYNWSALMKGTVYQSINKIASSLLYLKNSIGAVVAPLANYFAPVIDSVIDRVVELINQLNQLISKLTGASTWTKAIKTQTEWKDALDDSAKSAKQLTIGIDELNVVSDNKNATDYSGMFIEEVLPQEFNWIDSIKQLFSEGKFNELGSVVGTAFNSFVNKLSPKLQAIGEKIADNINKGVQIGLGFLSTADFENVGTTLANAFNKVVNKLEWKNLGAVLGKGWMVSFDIMRGFINSFGWEELGASVQKSVNALFDNIRARDVGDTISGLWNGIMKSFLAFVTKDEGLNWTRIGEKVAGFLNGLFVDFNWSDLSKSIYTSFNGLLETAETACNKFEWANFASELSGFINDTFENIQWGKLGGTLSRNAQKLFVTIRNFIADINWSSLGNKIGEMLNNVNWYDCFMAFWDITSTFCSGMADAILALMETTNVSNMFYQITTALIDTLFPSEDQLSKSSENGVNRLISAITTLLKKGIDGIWYAVKSAIKDKLREEGWDWLGELMFPDWLQAEYKAKLQIGDTSDRILQSAPSGKTTSQSIAVEASLEAWDRHRYATGGFPDEGQLFVAREAGAEMVGSIGNRTAVANNDQIVEAISIGVYDAVTSAMAGQKNSNTSVNVYLDGKQITSAVESRQRNRGATIYSGGLLVEG